MYNSYQPEATKLSFKKALKENPGTTVEEIRASFPPFDTTYQQWYSEALALIRQLLPDRLEDFVHHYNKPKSRKTISSESYRIEDCLQGLTVTNRYSDEKIVGPDAAIPHFEQQLSILRAVKARFASSLFDIRQLVMADLFDSELDAARELMKKGFFRAAGAVAGVVLEKHLVQVRTNHRLPVTRKMPTISNLNNQLKDAGVVDLPRWRSVQHLADIRNLCDHDKSSEPTEEQVADLIVGVDKTLKTLY